MIIICVYIRYITVIMAGIPIFKQYNPLTEAIEELVGMFITCSFNIPMLNLMTNCLYTELQNTEYIKDENLLYKLKFVLVNLYCMVVDKSCLINLKKIINIVITKSWVYIYHNKVLNIIKNDLYNPLHYTEHAYKPPFGLIPNRLMREDDLVVFNI